MPPRKKKRTKRKTKTKKIKEMIGRDLARDNIGTNQLLDYNQLINLIETTDVQYDEPSYNRYRGNLLDQQMNQQYGGDFNDQYQLKKASKRFYNELKDSLFKNELPVPVVNSWDAVAGGTATSMASPSMGSPSFILSPFQSSVSEIQATPVQDPDDYVYDELYKKINNKIYKDKFPSQASLNRWKTPIAKKLKTGGAIFFKKFDDIARQVYRDLYPDQPFTLEEERTPSESVPHAQR